MTIQFTQRNETSKPPFVLGIGGTGRINSTTELALRRALALAQAAGAETQIITGDALFLPHYTQNVADRSADARALIDALRRCDAVIFASPAYHGSVSGLVKNAIDYTEDMRNDLRPYLEDRAVASIVCAYGDQAIGATLSTLRTITHALRGWPVPIGVGINGLRCSFDLDGMPSDPQIDDQLRLLAGQTVRFAQMISNHLS